MELAELIYRMAQDSMDAGGLTDMTIGTVTSMQSAPLSGTVTDCPVLGQHVDCDAIRSPLGDCNI